MTPKRLRESCEKTGQQLSSHKWATSQCRGSSGRNGGRPAGQADRCPSPGAAHLRGSRIAVGARLRAGQDRICARGVAVRAISKVGEPTPRCRGASGRSASYAFNASLMRLRLQRIIKASGTVASMPQGIGWFCRLLSRTNRADGSLRQSLEGCCGKRLRSGEVRCRCSSAG